MVRDDGRFPRHYLSCNAAACCNCSFARLNCSEITALHSMYLRRRSPWRDRRDRLDREESEEPTNRSGEHLGPRDGLHELSFHSGWFVSVPYLSVAFNSRGRRPQTVRARGRRPRTIMYCPSSLSFADRRGAAAPIAIAEPHAGGPPRGSRPTRRPRRGFAASRARPGRPDPDGSSGN